MTFLVREAVKSDALGIRELFLASYGEDYPYTQFYEIDSLEKMIFADDNLILVAIDEDNEKKLIAIASVIMEVGAYSELVGEFGRLSVHPDYRRKGIGKLLMHKRLEYAEKRLHVGVIEARVVHPYAQRIAMHHNFVAAGILPLKHLMTQRENVAFLIQFFGDTLLLRKNNPRIIPEVYPIAHLVFDYLGIHFDAIVDEESPSYPHDEEFIVEELTTEGYTNLLRIQRGRIQNREIFGPMRLNYGFFKLSVRNARYLLLKSEKRIVGAIGFLLDEHEKSMRVFELITIHDQGIRFLLSELERKARTQWGIYYIEIDVSAYAPRMQRTLLELNYLPVAYVPAFAFHHVERLDVIKMVRLIGPPDFGDIHLHPQVQKIADIVLKNFINQQILPQISHVIERLSILRGLSKEQKQRFARICSIEKIPVGETILQEGEKRHKLFVIMEGKAQITIGEKKVAIGEVGRGEVLGEMSLLSTETHSASAHALTEVETLIIPHQELNELIRMRPDIGMTIYKNLAMGLGEKLKRLDSKLLVKDLAKRDDLANIH